MATLTESPEALAAPARPLRGRFAAAFAFGLLAVLALAAGAMAAFERSYEGRVLPGIHVGSVDLTGLTTAQASERLLAEYGELAEGELVLLAADQTANIAYADVGRRLDVDAVVAEAMASGRGGTLAQRIAVDLRTLVGGQQIDLQATLDESELRAAIEAFAREVAIEPTDAKIETTAEGFAVIASTKGRSADVEGALAAALAALLEPDAPATVELTLDVSAVASRVTTDEARAAITEARRLAQDIVLTNGSASATIAGATVRSWISFTVTADGALRPVVDRRGPESVLATFAPNVAREPVEPQFVVDNRSVVGIIPGADGAALDASTSATRIFQLLAARSGGEAITTSWVAITRVPPKLSDAEAASTAPRMKLISEWTTIFVTGISNNNGANIWIPASDIDGAVLAPGELFDFWKALGPVTRARGYGDGGAIINGRTEPTGALAGGICSTSTTLFNAAVRAGLEMGARKNHYYYITRYPLGLDATVYQSGSGSTQTMSFRNDTDYPILIRGYGWRDGTKGYVKFELYSVPTERTVSFTTPIVKNVTKASDSIEYTTALAPGVKQRIEYPTNGMDVWVTRTVRDAAGAVIHQETFVSHYHRITGVVRVGVAAAAPPPPPPPPPSEPAPSS